MTDLGSYWQNRAISSSSGAICSAETGTPGSSSANLQVASASYSASNAGGVPGNPTLETPSEAGAALQAVLTLNVSSQNELDLLLAAMLDNVTGGVNGTFQNVALYVPSLGLPSAVLAALANVTTTSDGLYGVPQDTGTSSTSSGSVWSLLWNTFSGLVDTVVADVQTVVSVVYDATVATLHFFENLPQALATWGETAIARTVSGLVTAGKVLNTALNDLLAAVVSGVKLILTPITRPLEQMASSYYSGLNNSMNSGNAAEFGVALSGNFFLLALGLGTAMEVAIGVATPVDLGPSFLITIVIGLLITVALEAASTTGVVNALSSVDSFGGQIVRDFQGWVNGTSASADVKLPSRYNQLASIFSLIAAVAVLPFSIGLLAKDLGFAGSGAPNPLTPVLGFALGIITLVLHFVFVIDHVPIYLLILGTILGGLALGLGLRAFKTRTPGPWKMMAAIDLGVGAAGLGVSVYEILSEG
jgi:hypothetical protein